MSKLPAFEGVSVNKSTLRLTKAGDGLSDALKLEPIALHHGDRVHLVLEGVVTQVNHRPDGKVEDGEINELTRMHTVEAVDIAIVDEDDVAELLARNRERIKLAKDAAEGVTRLPLDDDTPEQQALRVQHENEAHADGIVDGCPLCETETLAEAVGD
jgi:hypothetical protein